MYGETSSSQGRSTLTQRGAWQAEALPAESASALGCLDVDPAGRILSRDGSAALFLQRNPEFLIRREGDFFALNPIETFAQALAAACHADRPEATILQADTRAEGPSFQVNILPFEQQVIRVILFLPPCGRARDLPLPALTARERAVLQLAATGQRRDRIAYALNIALPTVDMHCRNLRRKLCALTTSEAVAIATKMNILANEP